MNIVDEIIRELGMLVPDGKLSVKDLQEILAKASNRVAAGKKQLEELKELIRPEKEAKKAQMAQNQCKLIGVLDGDKITIVSIPEPEMTIQKALQMIYDKLTGKSELARFDNCIIRNSEILKIDCVSINHENKQILANAMCASGKYPQIVINY